MNYRLHYGLYSIVIWEGDELQAAEVAACHANIVTWLLDGLAAMEYLWGTVHPYPVIITDRKPTWSKHHKYLEQSVSMPH